MKTDPRYKNIVANKKPHSDEGGNTFFYVDQTQNKI